VSVLLDDRDTPEQKPYSPYESTTRQCRIGGLHAWYRQHRLTGGEQVLITVLDEGARVYRLTLGQREQEREARDRLDNARTDVDAQEQLRKLARLERQPERAAAIAELIRLLKQQRDQKRRHVPLAGTSRREPLPANIRVLLRAVHDGKCQLCGFTFRKTDNEPYFEVHHIEADKGHLLWNLLVVCPNCHAQFEHADVGHLEKRGVWVIGVTINGERKAVYQPLVRRSDAVLEAARLACWLFIFSYLMMSHWRALP
jgi:5-methylcytosine-specific restriction endonuclease McrA